MSKGSPTHYLRANHQNRQPRRHVFIDTEASIEYDPDRQSQEQSFGLACARYLDNDPRRKAPKVTDRDYLDRSSLWADVTAHTRCGSRTVLWAHNLSYDLRISGALTELPALGWKVQAIVLDGFSCWARFTQPDRSLVCADFTSWANVPIETIGAWLRLEKPGLTFDGTAELRQEQLLERCRQDVHILHAAVAHVLEWVEQEQLGNLQITGAGQSWNAYRHRFMTERLLVHDDDRARKMERRAIWAGRTETFRHGIVNEPTFEWDLPRAYATVAQSTVLPTVWLGSLKRISVEAFRKMTADQTRRMLCEVSVTTESPWVCTEHDGRILWPVGKFRTTLWDCEIHALLERGASVRLYRTQVYTATPCLRDWATWILACLAQNDDSEPDVKIPAGASPDDIGADLRRHILKSWSRALIGRFALQYRSWEPFATSADTDLFLSDLTGPGQKRDAQLLQVGHDVFTLGEMTEGENSLPQITGYITAMCRVRLLSLIETAGWENVLYVDTDSLIVNAAGNRNLRARVDEGAAYGLSFKRAIDHLDLRGPRQLLAGGDRRFSGIPRHGKQLEDGTVTGEVWEGLGEALRNGRPDRVIVQYRTFNLTGMDKRREWLPDGTTRPITLNA